MLRNCAVCCLLASRNVLEIESVISSLRYPTFRRHFQWRTRTKCPTKYPRIPSDCAYHFVLFPTFKLKVISHFLTERVKFLIEYLPSSTSCERTAPVTFILVSLNFELIFRTYVIFPIIFIIVDQKNWNIPLCRLDFLYKRVRARQFSPIPRVGPELHRTITLSKEKKL